MSRGKIFISAGIGAVLLAAVIYVFREPFFCRIPTVPFQLAAGYTVKVSEAQALGFDEEVTSFMSGQGLTVFKASYRTSVPPERRTTYTGYQVEGCDGTSYIWSSNSSKPQEYLVTFHYNPIFKDKTKPLSDAFLAEFRPRYDVQPYTGWHPEPNQTRH